MRMLRLPAAHSLALRFPSSDGYLLDSIFFRSPRAHGVLPLRLGVGLPVSPHHSGSFSLEEASRISQVPREPFYAFALFSDPGRFSAPSPLAALRFCPRGQDYGGSNIDHYFEAQSHGFSTRSIRFVPTSLPTTQCSLPAGGQPLPGGVLFPLGPCIVFPRLVFFPITCFSSHSGFA